MKIQVKSYRFWAFAATFVLLVVIGVVYLWTRPQTTAKKDQLLARAISRQDISICDKIETAMEQESCYGLVAGAKQDSVLCEKIIRQELKEGCYSVIAYKKKDWSLCEKIANEIRRDGCFFEVAAATSDGALCKNIKTDLWRSQCELRYGTKESTR